MPKLLKTPFAVDAAEGYRTDIQESTGVAPNSATYQIGFPPNTMQSIAAGGMPPKGSDLNGVLYDVTDNLVFLTQGGGYGFDSAYATSIGGYPLNAKLRLNDGTEVISTIANNTNDPNVNLTGWVKTNSASQILDESGLSQQQLNNGVESIATLRSLNPKSKNRVYVKQHTSNLLGGGWFDWVVGLSATDNDGIIIESDSDKSGRWVRQIPCGKIYPTFFGAQCDGVFDDAIAIRKSCDYLTSKNIYDLYFENSLTYTIKSTLGKRDVCFVGDSVSNRYMSGNANVSRINISNDVAFDVFAYESNVRFKNLYIHGQNKKHTLINLNSTYQCGFENCTIQQFAKVMDLSTVYFFINNCHIVANTVGINLVKLSNSGTSNAGQPSTMLSIRDSKFLYNDYAICNLTAYKNHNYDSGLWAGAYMSSVGFEQNKYGFYAQQQVGYSTFNNCWFEANSAYGMYAPTSQVVEIQTMHSASPYVRDTARFKSIYDYGMKTPELDSVDGVLPVKFKVNIQFPDVVPTTDSPTTVPVDGKRMYQRFTANNGASTSSIKFKRFASTDSNYVNSGIVFSTGVVTSVNSDVERWVMNGNGHFVPSVDKGIDVGSQASNLRKIYSGNASLTSLRVFSDNASAIAGGLLVGEVYRASSGVLMVVY